MFQSPEEKTAAGKKTHSPPPSPRYQTRQWTAKEKRYICRFFLIFFISQNSIGIVLAAYSKIMYTHNAFSCYFLLFFVLSPKVYFSLLQVHGTWLFTREKSVDIFLFNFCAGGLLIYIMEFFFSFSLEVRVHQLYVLKRVLK